MCRQSSAFWRIVDQRVEVFLRDLESHSETEKYLPGVRSSWQEMHYLPSGEIECRGEGGVEASEMVAARWPLWVDFFAWALRSTGQEAEYRGSLYLCGLMSAEGLVLPKSVGGSLYLSGLTSAEGLVLPKSVGGSLDLRGLTSAKGLVLPKSVGGSLDLSGLTSAEGLVLPKSVGGSLYLSGLTSAERNAVLSSWIDAAGRGEPEKEGGE